MIALHYPGITFIVGVVLGAFLMTFILRGGQ